MLFRPHSDRSLIWLLAAYVDNVKVSRNLTAFSFYMANMINFVSMPRSDKDSPLFLKADS